MPRSEVEWATTLRRHEAICRNYDLKTAIQITRGRYFWPLEPYHPGNDIDEDTIAHLLSAKRRWGGNTVDPVTGGVCDYSVAQHSVIVSEVAEKHAVRLLPKWDWTLSPPVGPHGLMHDSTESYMEDFVRPIKRVFPTYGNYEDALGLRIYDHFKIKTDVAAKQVVHIVDNMMIFLERDLLMGKPCVPYSNEIDHPRITMHDVVPDFRVWSADEAKERFLARFAELKIGQ